jgi:hypothetical protein
MYMVAKRKYMLHAPIKIPRAVDIAWAAGFIEGDGHLYNRGAQDSVDVTQKQRWPLEQLTELFGGSIGLIHNQGVAKRTYNRWRLSGENARRFIEMIYPYLSPEKKAQCRGNYS